jgi:hypothetical protein
VERKKYGLHKARKAPQYSKRWVLEQALVTHFSLLDSLIDTCSRSFCLKAFRHSEVNLALIYELRIFSFGHLWQCTWVIHS